MKESQAVYANGNRQSEKQEPDPEVAPKAKRRRFNAEYKLRILTTSPTESILDAPFGRQPFNDLPGSG